MFNVTQPLKKYKHIIIPPHTFQKIWILNKQLSWNSLVNTTNIYILYIFYTVYIPEKI